MSDKIDLKDIYMYVYSQTGVCLSTHVENIRNGSRAVWNTEHGMLSYRRMKCCTQSLCAFHLCKPFYISYPSKYTLVKSLV